MAGESQHLLLLGQIKGQLDGIQKQIEGQGERIGDLRESLNNKLDGQQRQITAILEELSNIRADFRRDLEVHRTEVAKHLDEHNKRLLSLEQSKRNQFRVNATIGAGAGVSAGSLVQAGIELIKGAMGG